MKKHIIGVIAFAAIAVAAGWGYIQNKQNVKLSDLAMENIEALARDEGVEIVCGAHEGACWTEDYSQPEYNCGEYTMVRPCKFSGYMRDFCASPC